jgi:cysteine desulfurase
MPRERPIYLDHHATTPVDPRVLDAMLPFFTEKYGNAASISHVFGWEAEKAVDAARAQIAHAIGAEPREIVFTSGATESNNLALKGCLPALKSKGNHIVSALSEHRAVLDPLKRLSREGCEVTLVPCDATGLVSPESIASALTSRTILVSVMAANNEVGTINPLAEIANHCHERGILLHTDATQAVGKIPFDVAALNVDLASFNAHKLYGPKGIGALYVRRSGTSRPRLTPILDGGGHERGLRSGTLPVPLIVGFGLAVQIAVHSLPEEAPRLRCLRDRLHEGLQAIFPSIRLNGHPMQRLPGNLNLSFPGLHGEALMMAMRDIAVSSGAACSSAEPEPSHVLRAMGLDDDLARASLRFGIGRFTTEAEIDEAIAYTREAIASLQTQTQSVLLPAPG